MAYALGLDIGGTKIAAALITAQGTVHHRVDLPSQTDDAEAMFQAVVSAVEEVLTRAAISWDRVVGIGAGIPGKVDRQSGIAVFQNNLPWAQFPFVARIKERFPVPQVAVDNDVYAAAFAEYKRAQVQQDELFSYVTVSTGIACASIVNDTFIRGAGFAGEIGFLPVQATGVPTGFGPLEQVASGPAIQRMARALYQNERLVTRDVFEAYQNGEPRAKKIVEDATASLAHGLYGLCCVLDPHRIVFGGSVATRNPFFIDVLKHQLETLLVPEQRHLLHQMTVSQLGHDAGLIGAGLIAFSDALS